MIIKDLGVGESGLGNPSPERIEKIVGKIKRPLCAEPFVVSAFLLMLLAVQFFLSPC